MNVAVSRRVIHALLLAALVSMASAAAADSVATVPDSSARGLIGAPLSPPPAPATPESLEAAPLHGIPVFLGGREIYRVRSMRSGLDPAARAAAIRARLDQAVQDTETPADSVSLHRISDGVEVWLGRHFLWTIVPGDLAGSGVSDVAKMVVELPQTVRQGIERERRGRSPLGMLVAVLLALGLTLALIVLVRLLLAGGRRWRAFLAQRVPKFLGSVRLGTFEVLSHGQLSAIFVGVLGRAGLVVGVLLFYGYMTALFSLFPWSQGWSWYLLRFARAELINAAINMARAIPELLVIAVIFLVFRWLTRFSDQFFDAVDRGSVRVGWIHPDLAKPTKRLFKILLWVIAFAVAYPYIPGSQSKAVQGISILLGVMVSLGSSGFVGNMIAGLVLTYSRSFRAGDRVRIGEHVGDIQSMGFFAIKMRSVRNEEITLPNGYVVAQAIMNYTRLSQDPGLILHTRVTIGYSADWRTVHRLLIEAARRVEGVEPAPTPWVFQRALNDHHITYEICCVTRRSHQQVLLYSLLHQEIQDAFAREGVEIMSPAYAALRDGNTPVLPGEPEGPRAAPGGFRVRPQTDREPA